MGKRMLKIYYTETSDDLVEVTDVTYCCNKMQREFDNFEFGRIDNDEEPNLMIMGKQDNCIAISRCPFCGREMAIKPSRLGEKE